MSKIVDEVKNLVEKYAKECNVEIIDVEYVKKNNGYNLTIFIDKENGKVDIEDCVKLHKLIDKPLDEIDPTNGVAYILNVSSCGIDRPFKNLRDYLRAKGEIIEIKFYQPYNGNKVLVGELIDANDDKVKILDDNKNIIEIDFNLIASAKVLFIDKKEN